MFILRALLRCTKGVSINPDAVIATPLATANAMLAGIPITTNTAIGTDVCTATSVPEAMGLALAEDFCRETRAA